MPEKQLFLVTGATGGLGEVTCELLSQKGFIPVVGYRSEKRTDADIIAKKCNGEVVELDLTSKKQIDGSLEEIERFGGKLAGVALLASPSPIIKRFMQVEDCEMELFWQTSVLGNYHLLAGVVNKFFMKQKYGFVCAVLSKAMGTDHSTSMTQMMPYVVSKFGLKGLISALIAEYPFITTKIVNPSYIDTPMLSIFNSRWLHHIREKGEISSPKSVASRLLEHVAPWPKHEPFINDENFGQGHREQ